MKLVPILASLVLLPSLAACGFVHAENKVPIGTARASYHPDEEIEQLSVEVRAGSIDIRVAQGSAFEFEVDVEVIESRRHEFQGELVFGDHVRIRQDGDTLIVEDVHADASDDDDWELDLTLRVPGTLDVEADLGAGQIQIDLERVGEVELDCGAGDVGLRVGVAKGTIEMDLGAGRCELEVTGSAPTKNVSIDVGAGEIVVTLPQDVRGDFDLSVTAGDLTVDERYGLAVERFVTTASVDGEVGKGGPTFKLNAATGAIRLR